MKKILFLTNYPAPYRVQFFSKLGESCKLTVLFEEKAEEQLHRNQQWFNNQFDNFEAVFLRKIKVSNKVVSFEIFTWLKKEYDYIILGGYSTLTAQLAIEYLNIKRKRFYIEIDGGYHKNGTGIIEKWKKHLISSADGWFSPSTLSDEYLCFYGASINRIIRYPFSSLSQEDLHNNEIFSVDRKKYKEQLGIEETKMVLTVGQFIYRKANEVLINAAQYLGKDVGVYIVGGEPPKEYIELRENLELTNVHFVGFKDKEKLKEYYSASDVFAMPTREDIWGLVINEAMSFGLPIVSTNRCVAAVELVEDGKNGFIVMPDDPEQLGDRINYLLCNEDECLKMGQKSLELIKDYTIENMVKTHATYFDVAQ